LPANSAGDLVLHGNFTYLNLFEGNVCQNMVIDNSHGINGPYNTFFRNRADNYGLFMNSSPASDSQNYVGNEITNASIGLYILDGLNHFEYGNKKVGVITPAGTNNLTKKSYYLTEIPLYWDYYYNWPSIASPNFYNTGSNPAEGRYKGNKLSICPEDTLYYNFLVCLNDTLHFNGENYFTGGNYFDSAMNANGEKKYLDIQVQFTTKPTITETWFLESSSGVNYKWYLNGQLLPNDTLKTANINQNGYYQVEVIDSNGCESISDSVHVTSAGINEITNSIKIYPNPSQGEFIITGNKIAGSTYLIRDISGKLLLSQKINSNQQKVNLRAFKRGIYFIEVKGITAPKRIILN
jgi:hypothetical protein